MITQLYKNIAAGLKKVRNYTIYQEDVPQHFKQPSFLIFFYEQNPSNGINGRLKNSVSVDISYFPKDKENAKEECWEIGQELSWTFLVQDFKIRNRTLRIEDDVLHFMFDVDYRAICPDDAAKMQNMLQNTGTKKI